MHWENNMRERFKNKKISYNFRQEHFYYIPFQVILYLYSHINKYSMQP